MCYRRIPSLIHHAATACLGFSSIYRMITSLSPYETVVTLTWSLEMLRSECRQFSVLVLFGLRGFWINFLILEVSEITVHMYAQSTTAINLQSIRELLLLVIPIKEADIGDVTFIMICRLLCGVMGPLSCKTLLLAVTDGSANMYGSHQGVVTRLEAVFFRVFYRILWPFTRLIW